MKKDRILNPHLIKAIASLGHTDYLVICDAGLPIPEGVEVVDLSVIHGLPSFGDILQAVSVELVVESCIYAEEADLKNPNIPKELREAFPEAKICKVSHEVFKKKTSFAKTIVRTGECSSYANTILVGGVNF